MTDRELLESIKAQIDAHLAPPPPGPVDCVLSAWRLDSAGAWGACQSNGTQTRNETWVRDVVTPPSNGGAACGPTSEQRVGTQACTYVPPPAGLFIEAQWWDSPGNTKDLTATGTSHVHMGLRAPQVRATGELVLNFALRTFHLSGEIRQMVFGVLGVSGIPDRALTIPITDPHLFDLALPEVRFDTTLCPNDGWHQWQCDVLIWAPAQAGRPQAFHRVRMLGPLYVANGRPLNTKGYPGWVGSGQFSPQPDVAEFHHAYNETTLLTPVDEAAGTIPREIKVKPLNAGGDPMTLFATLNPDMHTHPPNLGTVLFDGPPPATKGRIATFTLPTGPQRVFMRTSDQDASRLANASAAVLVVSGTVI